MDIIKRILSKIILVFRKIFIRGYEISGEEAEKIGDVPPFLYFGYNHWQIFSSYIKKAEREIKILTGSISDTALSLLLENIRDAVSIKIITGRRRGYERILSMKLIERDNLRRCSRLHGKLFIVDGKTLLAGSSNITAGSLGNKERSSFFEADFVTEDPSIIASANFLFDVFWNESSDIEFLKNETGFISSAFGVPLKIKALIETAVEEIVIIVPTFFTPPTNYKSIGKYIRELNPLVKIKIITGYRISEDQILGYNEIKSLDNVEIIPVKNKVHAKVYLFDNRIALISSINLTFTSWISSLETGIIVEESKVLDVIRKTIRRLEKRQVPIRIAERKDTEPTSSEDDDIELLLPQFTPEGEQLRNDLKITPSLISVEVEENESKAGEIPTYYTGKIKTVSKHLGLRVIEPAFKEPGVKKKSRPKKPYQRKYPNLSYWSCDQLIQFAEENDIPLASTKDLLIRNIEDTNLKTPPRLYFLQNLFENSHIFSDYVGLALIDDLWSLSHELSKKYKRYSHYNNNLWYNMHYFILRNANKKAVIFLLEKYLAPKEKELRELLEKRLDKEEFFSIFPDKIGEQELREEKEKSLRKIKPYIRALIYYPDLLRRIIKEFGLRVNFEKMLREVEKDQTLKFTLNTIVSGVSRYIYDETFSENLEILLKNKKEYIIKMLELKFKIIEKECPMCGVKIKTNKNSCSACNSLYSGFLSSFNHEI